MSTSTMSEDRTDEKETPSEVSGLANIIGRNVKTWRKHGKHGTDRNMGKTCIVAADFFGGAAPEEEATKQSVVVSVVLQGTVDRCDPPDVA
ncbi:hypothetical protein GQ600_27557 [Phytophthora cactorum]|nr:hypothetical protein GQ600_27557 [Phytophthora cactorum]